MIETAEGDDGFDGAFGYFAVIGHRHRGTVPTRQLAPHDDVATRLPVPDKPMGREDAANLCRRERAKFRHALGSMAALGRRASDTA